jgi:1-deoxy-D-xylulose-5-phosphate reductoisomerase
MVEYVDGSVLAQLGNPDMRTPIAHALAFPERIASGVRPLDLAAIGRLDFEKPDLERFPCLRLAYDALHRGDCAPAILNAANEVAVAAFLDRRIGFRTIADVVARTLDDVEVTMPHALDDVLAIDETARRAARAAIAEVTAGVTR